MQMQRVCRSARPTHHLAPTTCQHRVRVVAARSLGAPGAATVRHTAGAPPRRLRACCRVVGSGGSGGATEPVPLPAAHQSVVAGEPLADAEAEVVAGVLESLEEAAIAGEDEGRRPTDYDRRAQIFEESSRVFRELKQRRDGGGGAQGGEPHRLG